MANEENNKTNKLWTCNDCEKTITLGKKSIHLKRKTHKTNVEKKEQEENCPTCSESESESERRGECNIKILPFETDQYETLINFKHSDDYIVYKMLLEKFQNGSLEDVEKNERERENITKMINFVKQVTTLLATIYPNHQSQLELIAIQFYFNLPELVNFGCPMDFPGCYNRLCNNCKETIISKQKENCLTSSESETDE